MVQCPRGTLKHLFITLPIPPSFEFILLLLLLFYWTLILQRTANTRPNSMCGLLKLYRLRKKVTNVKFIDATGKNVIAKQPEGLSTKKTPYFVQNTQAYISKKEK
jgi:hypothetical protein